MNYDDRNAGVQGAETASQVPAVSLDKVMAGRIRRLTLAVVNQLRWSWRFERFGWRSVLTSPDLIYGPKGIRIGRRVEIRKGARLEAIRGGIEGRPKLTIGDGTSIHMYFHCGAASKVEIGRNVLIAGRVYVTDHDHDPGEPGHPPVSNQSLIIAPTFIEDDCWLGEGCMVLKGVRLGRGCVVGAGSVVNRDVPPYTIVVGVPARPVKRYDAERRSWVPIAEEPS